MNKFLLVLKMIWGVWCIFILIIFVMDTIQFRTAPELYPIGWEGGGWSYKSSYNYILRNYLFIGWCILGLFPSVFYRYKAANYFLAVHFSISAIAFAWLQYSM